VFLRLPWQAEAFRASIDRFEALSDGAAWPAWFLANHDHARVASRFGPAAARAVLVMLHALRGTPFLYQGEELGLPDAEIPPGRVVDVDGRDPERAPIPWRPPSQAGPGAGFTTGEPWLPLVAEAEELCVARQAQNPASTLALARRLGALRRREPVLQTGGQRMLDAGDDLLAWVRLGEAGDDVLSVVNFAAQPRPFGAAAGLPPRADLLVSTDPGRPAGDLEVAALRLAPSEALLARLR